MKIRLNCEHSGTIQPRTSYEKDPQKLDTGLSRALSHSVEVSPLPNTLYRGAFEMLVLPRLLPENIYKQDFLAKRGGPYGDDPDQKLVAESGRRPGAAAS